ncbi:hypothetical protein ACLKA7_000793 [Drosophila subpalustris]
MRSMFIAFMEEYLSLGHMTATDNLIPGEPHCFIPYQCVERPQSTSTKLRVVFDASCPEFLQEDATKWPQNAHLTLKEQEKSLEKKKCATALIAVDAEPHPFLQIVQDSSSYLKVIGIVAYALRFINKRKGLSWKSIVPSADEYSAAFLTIVEIIQQESFSDHIGKLRKSLSLHSSYQKLNPFISAEQVGNNKFLLLRVGDLSSSTFNIYTKPIVMLALVP